MYRSAWILSCILEFMTVGDTLATIQTYNTLIQHPLATLRQALLQVNALPQVADGTANYLFFAYRNLTMAIDDSQDTARALVGGADITFAVQRSMVISVMRGSGLRRLELWPGSAMRQPLG
jgi:hypothetical protein